MPGNDFAYPKWLSKRNTLTQKAKPQWTGSVLGNPGNVHSAFDCKTSHIHYCDCNWTHSLKRLSLHSIVTFYTHGREGREEKHSVTHTHRAGEGEREREQDLFGCRTLFFDTFIQMPYWQLWVSPNLSQCTNATDQRFHCLLQHTILGLRESFLFLFTNACLMNKRTMAKGHICRKRKDRAVTCKHNLLDIFRIQHGLIK